METTIVYWGYKGVIYGSGEEHGNYYSTGRFLCGIYFLVASREYGNIIPM